MQESMKATIGNIIAAKGEKKPQLQRGPAPLKPNRATRRGRREAQGARSDTERLVALIEGAEYTGTSGLTGHDVEYADETPPPRPRHCSVCGLTGHDKRNCPVKEAKPSLMRLHFEMMREIIIEKAPHEVPALIQELKEVRDGHVAAVRWARLMAAYGGDNVWVRQDCRATEMTPMTWAIWLRSVMK